MLDCLTDEIDAEGYASLANDSGFKTWLLSSRGGDFRDVKDIGNGLYAGIKSLLFHWTLIVGEIGDTVGYADRWCYATKELAEAAFREWSGEGEPTRWHRHPATGRRRPDGDPTQEYIAA